ncbi:hypothetical protein DFH07DRAFT_776592 [Mycena maculata]|uniref:Uncharacterized protein n=1 Tax=Mycena maculata TaxID=230809 RepID=A0AAD7ILH9_9AGAR|nr:hypothetical protein DFH07DRAFT_776592 [Mycena maculata]
MLGEAQKLCNGVKREKKNVIPEIGWSQLRHRFTPGFEDILDVGVNNGWYDPDILLEVYVMPLLLCLVFTNPSDWMSGIQGVRVKQKVKYRFQESHRRVKGKSRLDRENAVWGWSMGITVRVAKMVYMTEPILQCLLHVTRNYVRSRGLMERDSSRHWRAVAVMAHNWDLEASFPTLWKQKTPGAIREHSLDVHNPGTSFEG